MELNQVWVSNYQAAKKAGSPESQLVALGMLVEQVQGWSEAEGLECSVAEALAFINSNI